MNNTEQVKNLPLWLLGMARVAAYCGVTSRGMAEDAAAWCMSATSDPLPAEHDINVFLAFTKRGRAMLHNKRVMLCPNNPFCFAALYRARDELQLWQARARASYSAHSSPDSNAKSDLEERRILSGSTFDCWNPDNVPYLETALELFSEHISAGIPYGALCHVCLW